MNESPLRPAEKSITFECPWCKNTCAFKSVYAGKRAKCIKCDKRFIIPHQDYGKAIKYKENNDEDFEPRPDFFKGMINNWKLLFKKDNSTGLVFISALVCFPFFFSYLNFSTAVPGFALNLQIGDWILFGCWGLLFFYYMEVIELAGEGFSNLPDVEVGSFLDLIWNIIKPLFLFVIALLTTQIPALIVGVILSLYNVEMPIFQGVVATLGLVYFPFSILGMALGPDISAAYRWDIFIKFIRRQPKEYLAVAGILCLVIFGHWYALDYGDLQNASYWLVAIHLTINIILQYALLCTMRAIGLLYWHYNCYLKW